MSSEPPVFDEEQTEPPRRRRNLNSEFSRQVTTATTLNTISDMDVSDLPPISFGLN